MNQKEINKNVDESVVRELVLWFENTEELYNRRDAWVQNYQRKIKRGVFNEELAIKGIVNLVEEVKHNIVFHLGHQVSMARVNAATKLQTAKEIYESSIKPELVFK